MPKMGFVKSKSTTLRSIKESKMHGKTWITVIGCHAKKRSMDAYNLHLLEPA